MKWFFKDEEKQRELLGAVQGWIGTPFRPFTRRKKVGVDCVNLAAGIYMECGLLSEFTPPKYRMDYSLHCSESMVIPYIESTGRFAALPALSELMAGDLLVFQIGNTTHHVGIMINDCQFVHVYAAHFVMVSETADSTWQRRLHSVYRPLKVETPVMEGAHV